jgi:hypothetical protein
LFFVFFPPSPFLQPSLSFLFFVFFLCWLF